MYNENQLYVTADTTSAQYQSYISVNAHELAHMLWGDLFTPMWWSDTWSKEGSATFWANVGMQHIMRDVGDWQTDAQAVAGYQETALRNDAQNSTVPLIYPAVVSPAQIQAHFGGPTYNSQQRLQAAASPCTSWRGSRVRAASDCSSAALLMCAVRAEGGSFLRMIQQMLGYSAFQKACQNFLAAYRFSNAWSIDLFGYFSAQASMPGKNLTDVLWSWGSQAGFPLIIAAPFDAAISESGYGTVAWQLTQQPYRLSSQQLWPVWVQYSYQYEGEDPVTDSLWLDSSNNYVAPLTLDPSKSVLWCKLNTERRGFYRVLYPLLTDSPYAAFQSLLSNVSNPPGWTHQDKIGLLLDAYQTQLDGYLQSWETVKPQQHPAAARAAPHLQSRAPHAVCPPASCAAV